MHFRRISKANERRREQLAPPLLWRTNFGTSGLEDVAFFAVLIQVEPLVLLLFGDTQANGRVDQL